MMGKQERREKAAQDLQKRLGVDVAQMTPEEFASAVDVYIGQRLHEADTCEAGARVTDREFLAAKAALLEILTDHRNTPSQRLRAAEFLAALPEIFEQLQWSFVL
jgi:hypothetical protein